LDASSDEPNPSGKKVRRASGKRRSEIAGEHERIADERERIADERDQAAD
jgi:hypothetical protein